MDKEQGEKPTLVRLDPEDIIETFEELPAKFGDRPITDDVLRGIFAYGFEHPSDIQKHAIVPLAKGRDCIFQAHSGKGKTGAFLIGGALRIDKTIQAPQIIIVEPTKILAEQTYAVAANLFTDIGINVALHIGGVPKSANVRGDYRSNYRRNNDDCPLFGEHIVVGTPGRILDVLEPREGRRQKTNIRHIQSLILDEADQLLTAEFQDKIKAILQLMSYDTQAVLVSATMPYEMLKIANHFIRENHVRVLIPEDEVSLEGIKQYYVDVEQERWKTETLLDILSKIPMAHAFVFVNSKGALDSLRSAFEDAKIQAEFLHGDMNQLEREQVMFRFRKGSKFLVTTDLTARGIDIQQVSLVINYDVPKYHTTFIHRVGRSGRYGKKGTAITFLTKDSRGAYEEICQRYFIQATDLPADFKV